MQSRIYELFEQLRLPRAAAAVYCALLLRGPLARHDIAHESGQDGSDLANAVSLLRTMRLIGDDLGQWYAAEPARAWLAIVADQVWGNQTTLAPIDQLPSITDPRAEGTRKICEEIGTVACEMYRPYSAIRNHGVLDAETPDQMSMFTREIINRATTDIVAVRKSPREQQLSSFWAVLTDRLSNHGVTYRCVTDLEEVEAHGLKIVARDAADYGIRLRVLEQARIRHKFYAVDGKYVVITHQTVASAEQRRRGVGRVTNYLDVVRRYVTRFEQYFADAIPSGHVIDQLESAGRGLIARARRSLPPFIVTWLQDVIDYGKFSTFNQTEDWPPEKMLLVERTATDAALVRRNSHGEIVPLYGVSEAELRQSFIAAGSQE